MALIAVFGMFFASSGITSYFTYNKEIRSGKFGTYTVGFKQPEYFRCYDYCDTIAKEYGKKYYYGSDNYRECVVTCMHSVPYNRIRMPGPKFYK